MYKQEVLNAFYEELFYTDFHDCESSTQNAKTDILIGAKNNITFDTWLTKLIEIFCKDCDYTELDVRKAIKQEPEFEEDLKSEFEDLAEECQDILDEEDED